jgi:hypothetical protein
VVIETYQNGSRYEGEKLNGARDGRVKFYYLDGGLYGIIFLFKEKRWIMEIK